MVALAGPAIPRRSIATAWPLAVGGAGLRSLSGPWSRLLGAISLYTLPPEVASTAARCRSPPITARNWCSASRRARLHHAGGSARPDRLSLLSCRAGAARRPGMLGRCASCAGRCSLTQCRGVDLHAGAGRSSSGGCARQRFRWRRCRFSSACGLCETARDVELPAARGKQSVNSRRKSGSIWPVSVPSWNRNQNRRPPRLSSN